MPITNGSVHRINLYFYAMSTLRDPKNEQALFDNEAFRLSLTFTTLVPSAADTKY